ncbi:MAG: helix-turn-helix domain-containing protein [Parcubacteria group bacterium]|jgi:sugar-specific transcriptional regulator TrmB
MEIKQVLEQFGLEGRKADVYLAALELGGTTVLEIAKKAGIKRTTTYDILLDLKEKGLISETVKGKKTLYLGEDPEKIQKDLKIKEEMFAEILPQLKSIHNTAGNKPKIRFYEGKEGLREVYNDTLKYSGEILGFASEDVVKILGHDWAWDYMKRRKQKHLTARFIMPATEFMQKEVASQDQEQLRSSKVVDPKKYPFSIEINIYGFSKVALMSSKEETGLIIESSEIYKTMKLIFELIWDNLPEIKKI